MAPCKMAPCNQEARTCTIAAVRINAQPEMRLLVSSGIGLFLLFLLSLLIVLVLPISLLWLSPRVFSQLYGVRFAQFAPHQRVPKRIPAGPCGPSPASRAAAAFLRRLNSI